MSAEQAERLCIPQIIRALQRVPILDLLQSPTYRTFLNIQEIFLGCGLLIDQRPEELAYTEKKPEPSPGYPLAERIHMDTIAASITPRRATWGT